MTWLWKAAVLVASGSVLVSQTYAQAQGVASGLESQLGGVGVTAVFPDSPLYANASRPFNLRFLDNHPAAVAYPSTAEEVSEIVKVANRFGLHVVARSGGHSYIANGLGGRNGSLVVDLSNMTKISVDTKTFNAVIETGNRLAPVAIKLNEFGRGIPHGSCGYVGIGGHAGHGGFGFASRMWGLTLDTVLAVEVVLANGTLVRASETQNADLFWAMRGAASSFGITTSLTVKTFAAPSFAMVYQYNWQLTFQGAADALGLFQSFVLRPSLPPQLGLEIVLTPGHEVGNVTFGLTGAWYGDPALINSTIQPFLDEMPAATGPGVFSGNGTWIDSVSVFAGGLDTSQPDGTDTFYAKSVMTPEEVPLDNNGRVAMMKYLSEEGVNSATGWFMELELYGGSNSAINAVPFDATAFAHRNKMLTMQFYTQAQGNVPPFPNSGFTFLNGLVGNITAAMPSNWPYGAYVNYIDDHLQNWQQLYYGTHYPKLEQLKKEYDPRNVFKFPLSIEE